MRRWLRLRPIRSLLILIPIFIGFLNFHMSVTMDDHHHHHHQEEEEETFIWIRGYDYDSSNGNVTAVTDSNVTATVTVTDSNKRLGGTHHEHHHESQSQSSTQNLNHNANASSSKVVVAPKTELELKLANNNKSGDDKSSFHSTQTDDKTETETETDNTQEELQVVIDTNAPPVQTRTNHTSPNPGESGLLFEQQQQQCPRRNLTEYAEATIGKAYLKSIAKSMRDANCLFYECNKNSTECNSANGFLPTNYNGPKPPCCNHILRDMTRIFDETMCDLGLDYVTAFGTLLGYHRDDQIIPWTIDADYILPNVDVANAMVELWDKKKTGMSPILQNILRMCVTPDFANGQLKRWSVDKPSERTLCLRGFPYMDFYQGYKNSSKLLATLRHCRHLYSDVFPTKRTGVYNNTFTQNFPANPDQLLRTFYGIDWMTPRSDKDPQGGSRICPYGPTYGA